MKKKVIQRCLIGAPVGIALSFVITILISIIAGDGNYYAVVPGLAAECGSELNAVIIQTVFSLIYGAAFGGASVIWQTEWSITKMSVIHLIICSVVTFPMAYLMRWMEHSVFGVLKYFGIFMLIYVGVWLAQYLPIKKKINEINRKVNEQK